jgi:hypothetical protein
VLLGAEGIIDKYGIDVIHLEFAPKLINFNGETPASLLQWLRKKGYVCFDCKNFQPPAFDKPRTLADYGNHFGAFHYMEGDTGEWTDLLCLS